MCGGPGDGFGGDDGDDGMGGRGLSSWGDMGGGWDTSSRGAPSAGGGWTGVSDGADSGRGWGAEVEARGGVGALGAQQEQARQAAAEQARQAEVARQAELARKAEEARIAEEKRVQETRYSQLFSMVSPPKGVPDAKPTNLLSVRDNTIFDGDFVSWANMKNIENDIKAGKYTKEDASWAKSHYVDSYELGSLSPIDVLSDAMKNQDKSPFAGDRLSNIAKGMNVGSTIGGFLGPVGMTMGAFMGGLYGYQGDLESDEWASVQKELGWSDQQMAAAYAGLQGTQADNFGAGGDLLGDYDSAGYKNTKGGDDLFGVVAPSTPGEQAPTTPTTPTIPDTPADLPSIEDEIDELVYGDDYKKRKKTGWLDLFRDKDDVFDMDIFTPYLFGRV